MSGNNDRGLNDQLHPYVYRALTSKTGADRYADGTTWSPGDPLKEPAKRSGNPFINPETGERYPGAPGA